jgi:separase
MAQSLPEERSILKALESPATCTTETVLSIKNIFASAIPVKGGRDEKENKKGGLGHARAKSLVSTTKVTAKTAGRTKAHTRQLTVVEIKQEVVLTEADKVNFAFQVVNGCIKNLSQLAKEYVLARRGADATVNEVKTKTHTKPTAPPDTVLQPKSPNARRFNAIDEVCRAPAKKTPPTPAATTAACACAALAHLQAHYKVSDGKDSACQVENGTLAVIAKCIDLDLVEPALQQLRALKRRLLEHLGCSSKSRPAEKDASDIYRELLDFPSEVRSSPMLPFAVKVQQHAWQLVSLQAEPAALDLLAGSEHVQCELLRAHTATIQDTTKVTRQLMSTSRLLLQLSMRQGLSVDAVFHLRCSAFSLQIEASASGLNDEEMRGICVKVAKCLDAFEKGSRSGVHKRRRDAQATINPFLKALDGRPTCADEAVLLRRILKRLAGDRGNPQEPTPTGELQSSAIDTIRAAAEKIGSIGGRPVLDDALHALRKSLPEDRAMVDRLLVEVVGLRRLLHKAVAEKQSSGIQSFPLATACISFLRQYLGILNNDHAIDASFIEDRLRLGRKFVKPFISTLVICCLHHESPTAELFTALQDASDMFLAIVQLDGTFADERFSDKRHPETSIFVTVSKLCHKIWNSRVNAHSVAEEVAVAALKASIRVMRPWTTAEKEAIAYTQKLRYLMDAHLAREDWQSAHSTFVQLLGECKEAGYLADMTEQSATASPHQLREKGSMGGLLYRCLQSFVTVSIKSNLEEASILHAKHDLDAITQGLLLEWQLDCLNSYISQHRTTDPACVRLIEQTRDELLRLYSKKSFPVRRLRVGVAIARLSSMVPNLCQSEDLLSEVSISPLVKIPVSDAGLRRHVGHLQATLQASLALLDPHGDRSLERLKASLDLYEVTCSSIICEADLVKSVAEVDGWLEHLESLVDFYALRRDAHMETRTLEVVLCALKYLPDAYDHRVKVLSRLATTCLTMGHSNNAQKALAAAESDVASGKCSVQTRIALLLAKAEYSSTIEDDRSCGETLGQASKLATAGGEDSFVQQTFASASSTLNIYGRRLVARAAYLHSAHNLHIGNLATALRSCTTAKCMLFKTWSSLEQNMPRDHLPAVSTSIDGCPSSDDPSAIEDVQPVVVTRSYSHLSNPQLRMLVPDLLQVAMLEMKIHGFRGAYHEAFAALKHANKIANYVGAGAACLSDMIAADLYVRSLPIDNQKIREEKVQDARSRIDMVDEAFLNASLTLDTMLFGSIKADILAAESESEEQLETLEATLTKLKAMAGKAASSSRPASREKDVDDLAGQLSSMTLERKSQAAKSSRTTKAKTVASKPPKKPSRSKAAEPETNAKLPVKDDGQLNMWRGKLLRDTCTTALTYHSEPDVERLFGLMEEANDLVGGIESLVKQGIAWSYFYAHQASSQMAADITFNALQDSIVSVPSPTLQDMGASMAAAAPMVGKTPRKGKAPKAVAKVVPSSEPAFLPLLQKAFQAVHQTWQDAYRTSSSTKLRLQSQLLANISVMAGGCGSKLSSEMTHPLVFGYHHDAPSIRIQALNRAAEDPAVEKLEKADLRSWPAIEQPMSSQTTTLKQSDFQRDFIDIIPASWNVVSMSLTDDKAAMKLVKYRAGQSPFILRIPFAHREADDPDEVVLDMALAYERLRAIIKQHEFTAVEAGVTDTADFKKKWWQRKHDLDAELRLLLFDVEEQWFSAAKGIFSSHRADDQDLSNLEAQLQAILLQHCPTKKGRGKAKSGLHSLKIESRILELFVGLGEPDAEIEVEGESGPITVPRAETSTLAEGIHDLVRLILEGLQFAGESIAIDEVDMDSVIIKIIDALRDYYGSLSTSHDASGHTVLLLDNQLHGFPWESLPCLRSQSLSRLPSLADLRDRLLAARSSEWNETRGQKTISRSSGTSLVNPSGDLKKTAQRFQPWLTKLPPNWAHLRKAPDDEGWKDLLSENELFLYVGHGSTSQYVRPRVVKRLGYKEPNQASGSTCAVSWLIGCSSVGVEDLGEFQPSGMVLSYLAAGSPAVLGALWDVGDIDADHFSITAGDYWGLWDESNKGLDPKLFPARKKISEEKKALGRSMSMCEAVARSRGGCKLPYLNGAAFVVYGIPVFLD